MKVTITRGNLQLTLDECSANDLVEVLRALPTEAAPITWPVAPMYPHPVVPWYDPGTTTPGIVYRTITSDRTS